jgi:hypothetical protein
VNETSPSQRPEQNITSINPPNPYEQTVRVITIFFSAVTGLGLKELLDPKRFGNRQTLQALCFACAFLLLLRFLFGSANHLWAEANALQKLHYKKAPASEKLRDCPAAWLFAWHLLCLIFYFLLMMWICYAADTAQFLLRSCYFSATACVLALVGHVVEKNSNFNLTWFWLWTNAIQSAAALSLYFTSEAWLISKAKLFLLGLLFLGILLGDVAKQIVKLEVFCRDLEAGKLKSS